MSKFVKKYDNYDKDISYSDYVRITKLKNGSVMFKYYFEFSHIESLDTEHIKSTEKPEYVKTTKQHRIVYYENIDKRERIVLDKTKIGKRGRKYGSKDSYQRTRHSKENK